MIIENVLIEEFYSAAASALIRILNIIPLGVQNYIVRPACLETVAGADAERCAPPRIVIE